MQEAVHADAVLQAEGHLHLRGYVKCHLRRVYVLYQVRRRFLVQPPLDGADGTGYLDVVRIAVAHQGQVLAARVGVAPTHLEQVFRHDVLMFATQVAGQLLQRAARCRTESEGLEELLARRVLQDIPHCVQRVLRQRKAGLQATRPTGKACAHQRGGQRHVRMLAYTQHDGFQGTHPPGRVPGRSIVAGCLGRQLTEGDEGHTLRIVAQGQTAVVQGDNDGVEDGPRNDGNKDEFGQQPAVAAATGPEGM